MLGKEIYPILEFDDNYDAIINPEMVQAKYGVLPSDMLVITFFKEALNILIDEKVIEKYLVLTGENDLILYKFVQCDVFIMHGVIGGVACGGFLDELIGIGIKRIMFCGGGGVLDKNIGVGELLVVEGAIRDDGMSYHYAKPSRIIDSNKEVKTKIIEYLQSNNLPYLEGLVWTTDAFYRETKAKIALRKAEGAKIVEMEQAGLIAVSQFRKVKYGAIIYGGDDVSQEVWDKRGWNKKKSLRYSLIMMCKEIVQTF